MGNILVSTVIFVLSLISIITIKDNLKTKATTDVTIVYCGSYFITSFLGCVLLSSPWSPHFWALLKSYSIDVGVVPHDFTLEFWILLFMPFFVPFWMMKCLRLLFPYKLPIKIDTRQCLSFSLVLSLFVGTMLVILFMFHLSGVRVAFHMDGYAASIQQRGLVISSLGSFGCGLVYIAMPVIVFLCQGCINYHKDNSLSGVFKWKFLLATMLMFYAFLTIFILRQKILLCLLVALLGLNWLLRSRKYLFKIFMVLFSIISLVYFYASQLQNDFGWLNSIELIIFRMASGLPFLYNLYSNNHTGFQMFGAPHHENIASFLSSVMYPKIVGHLQGSNPVPAHFDAFAQGGVPYVFFIFFLISILMWILANLKVNDVISFSLKYLLLTTLYYTTQVKFTLVVLGSYGLIYGLMVLIIVFVFQFCTNKTRVYI